MRFESIDLPAQVIEAQEKGELVLFAGAGVSIPSPSDLPNFRDLANELANGTAHLQNDEAIDRFLGKLPREFNIYERTQIRLQRTGSKPNPLHRDLMKVFGRSSAVRLVTTNFDDHFATAANEFFKTEPPEMYYAPALPVGGDFTGIVHLHGSVKRDAKRMVLTDIDFGRAYLTDGWARRFVQGLFLKYTVLFIGYSHQDPVMHYIARGLPPIGAEQRRFALAPEGNESFWNNLGIQLLPYKKKDEGSNPHVQLQRACALWANHVLSTPLENRERIRRIVEKPPMPIGDEIDFIEKAIGSDNLVRFFIDTAETVEWLKWIENRDAFKRLFQPLLSHTKCDYQLASWFASRYAVKHCEYALDVIRKNGDILPPILWEQIAGALWRAIDSGEIGGPLRKWIPLLIRFDNQRSKYLDYILKNALPEQPTAMLLFRHLTRPIVELSASLSKNASESDIEPYVSADVKLRGDLTFITRTWSIFKENDFSSHVQEYIALATFHLEEATLLYLSYGGNYIGWDPISVYLPRFDRPNVTNESNPLTFLAEIARFSLRWLIDNEKHRAISVIEGWSSSRSLTLKRLAIYGAALTTLWSADEKLSWLLAGDYVYMPGVKDEVDHVLQSAFPTASETERNYIAQKILNGPKVFNEVAAEDRHIYSMASRLEEIAPGHGLIVQAIHDLRAKYPELEPKVVADQSSELGPPWERLPFDKAKLLAHPPSVALRQLLEFEPPDRHWSSRQDVVALILQTVQTDNDWGLHLASELVDAGELTTDLWSGIIQGLNSPQLEANKWHAILSLLSKNPQVIGVAVDATVSLLERGIVQESGGIKGDVVPLAVTVSHEAWTVISPRDWRVEESQEWLTMAINDAAGILLQFEMRLLLEEYRAAGNEWKGLTPQWRMHFTDIARGSSWSDGIARVILASGIHVLFEVDPEWTIQELYPAFDFTTDSIRAKQVWHGYLFWGRWSDKFLESFFPNYLTVLPNVKDKLGRAYSQFYEHMASIALLSNINPHQTWVNRFILAITPQDRVDWAKNVGVQLGLVAKEKVSEIWLEWMKPYWESRVQGVPLLLSSEEVGAMIGWSLRLKSCFPESVTLALKGPAPILGTNEYLYHQLSESQLAAQFPSEFAHLLLLLMRSSPPVYLDEVGEMVRVLIPTSADRAILSSIVQRLAECSYSAAPDLERDIRRSMDS